MRTISICAATDRTRTAIASLLEDEPDYDIQVAERLPSRLDHLREDDVLVLGSDLDTADRLQVLGLVWRSNHPPRTLFLDLREDSPDEPRAESRERCVEALHALVVGASSCTRVSVTVPADERDESVLDVTLPPLAVAG